MGHQLDRLIGRLYQRARIVHYRDDLIPEIDLIGPMMLPKVCVVRALVDRMRPGQRIVLRSTDLEMPWEMEHMCNRLGHELLEVGREGEMYFFTLRIRGADDRLPTQDPFTLDLSPQAVIQTVDITPEREPSRIRAHAVSLPTGRTALKAKKP